MAVKIKTAVPPNGETFYFNFLVTVCTFLLKHASKTTEKFMESVGI